MQFCNLRGGCGPNIYALLEAHDQIVGVTPVDQIQVEIVSERWSVKDLEGNLGDLSGFFWR